LTGEGATFSGDETLDLTAWGYRIFTETR
jgi:hypothetical protein